MRLEFDARLAAGYTNATQRARVLTESWVHTQAYCPNCGCAGLDKYPNNRPVGDFFCSRCNEDFELKSQRLALGAKMVDGAYRTMLECIRSNKVPNFFALSYDAGRDCVRDLVVVPSHFFSLPIIERRKPLAETARRAGWTGCNILLGQIPKSGRVDIVVNGVVVHKTEVLSAWKRMLFLRDQLKPEARGWLLDILKCIEMLGQSEFSLADVYRYEGDLQKRYPNNNNIRPKIRQQLQVLRDVRYLAFTGRANYRII